MARVKISIQYGDNELNFVEDDRLTYYDELITIGRVVSLMQQVYNHARDSLEGLAHGIELRKP